MVIWLRLSPSLPEIKNSNTRESKWNYLAKPVVTKEEVGDEKWKNYLSSPPLAMLVNVIYTEKHVVLVTLLPCKSVLIYITFMVEAEEKCWQHHTLGMKLQHLPAEGLAKLFWET